jgi:hypothetical protein
VYSVQHAEGIPVFIKVHGISAGKISQREQELVFISALNTRCFHLKTKSPFHIITGQTLFSDVGNLSAKQEFFSYRQLTPPLLTLYCTYAIPSKSRIYLILHITGLQSIFDRIRTFCIPSFFCFVFLSNMSFLSYHFET